MLIDIFGITWKCDTYTKWAGPRYDNAYFGHYGVSIVKRNDVDNICLSVIERPEKFIPEEENCGYYGPSPAGTVTKNLCCGEVKGPTLSYGTYIWSVEMPEYKNIWPALWLCGKETWPPEIDVVEGYTEDRGDYIKNCLTTKLETNCHYRVNMINGKSKNVGAKGIPTIIYKMLHKKNKPDIYKLVWKKDSVKIYFNGVRIRKITNKNFLKCANESAKMFPIMNMMVDTGYIHDNENPPKMYISNFEYYSNNKFISKK